MQGPNLRITFIDRQLCITLSLREHLQTHETLIVDQTIVDFFCEIIISYSKYHMLWLLESPRRGNI